MSKIDLQSTIVALGSGPSSASRAIVRLSGIETKQLLGSILDSSSTGYLASKKAISWPATCHLALDDDPLWEMRFVPVRVYFWPNEKCYTGEPSAEIHLPGNQFLVEQMIKTLSALGARHAQRGEFTLRSFLAGKIDLTQAEGVLGVIESSSEVALEEALGRLGGNISKPVRILRFNLLELIAHLEAGLDFIEEDIEFITEEDLRDKLIAVIAQLKSLIQQVSVRSSTKTTPRYLLVGQPNAGKSSLFNLLLSDERAIVSNQAGTTRDAIVAELDCNGVAIEIVDTAGVEEHDEDSPRGIAQQVVLSLLNDCDGAVVCQDISKSNWPNELREIRRLLQLHQIDHLCIGTKADLIESQLDTDQFNALINTAEPSTRDIVLEEIGRMLKTKGEYSRSLAMHEASLRCQQGLSAAKASIEQAVRLTTDYGLRDQEELVAVELRFALEELGSVIGEVHNEDILGEIFSRFCIGK